MIVLVVLVVMVMTLFMTHVLVTTIFFITHDQVGVLLLVTNDMVMVCIFFPILKKDILKLYTGTTIMDSFRELNDLSKCSKNCSPMESIVKSDTVTFSFT